MIKKFIVSFSILICASNNMYAADAQAQANNPLANMQALNFQNYYITDITGLKQKGDTFWVRYAQPINKFLIRASMPFTSYPISPTAKKNGSGDLNAFAACLIDTGNPAVSAGVGPLVVVPSASPSSLGAGKWQGGFAAVYFNANSVKFQYGGLVTYQTDFAGPSSRSHTSSLAIQPFGFYQLDKGYYLRTAPIWIFDLKNEARVIPFSLGIGKVIKSGKTVYNFFIEPQFSVSDRGTGLPRHQIFAALNLQFAP